MSRFQAKTNNVLDAELDELRRELGLRDNQKADLLRELTALASWVVHQARQGRTVIARGQDDVRELDHPTIERIRRRHAASSPQPARLILNDDEATRLAEILERGGEPSPAILACLRGLAAPDRTSPAVRWSDSGPA